MVEALHEPGIDYTAAAELISRVGGVALSYVELILASNPSLKGIERPVSVFLILLVNLLTLFNSLTKMTWVCFLR
jgi:hypothetical protein